MKYCSHCGTQIPDEALFCPNCGTRVITPAQQPVQQPVQQPAEKQQHKKKFISMDNFRANREAQKQRRAKMKWWHWALIAIGVAILTMMEIGA